MSNLRSTEWRRLAMQPAQLCINTTLRCGQSFRWKRSAPDEWSCALRGRILCLRQDCDSLHYRATFPAQPSPTSNTECPGPDTDDTLEFIRHYFNLGYDLDRLYEEWARADPNFKAKAPKFTGVRILKQDHWEALVGFICSSNNNIARISQMMDKLCASYGPLLGQVGPLTFHDFPPPSALTDPKVEHRLRELGFGYRARYVHQAAVVVAAKGIGWLDSLRNPETAEARPTDDFPEGGRDGYRTAHEQLLALPGVGPKVADCVCLMGLGWGEAVPVDTHIWQIARRDYQFGHGKHTSLTKAMYDGVANGFRSLWGKDAGWAHSVLFTANLKAFSERLAVEAASTVKPDPAGSVGEQRMTQQATGMRVKRMREEGDPVSSMGREDVKIARRMARSARGY